MDICLQMLKESSKTKNKNMLSSGINVVCTFFLTTFLFFSTYFVISFFFFFPHCPVLFLKVYQWISIFSIILAVRFRKKTQGGAVYVKIIIILRAVVQS